MFSFEVEVDDDIRRARLDVKSPHVNASFSPDCHVPKFRKVDVMAVKGEFFIFR